MSYRRVPGVGDIREFSTQYAMRIWLDPGQAGQLSSPLACRRSLGIFRSQNSHRRRVGGVTCPYRYKIEITATIQNQGRNE